MTDSVAKKTFTDRRIILDQRLSDRDFRLLTYIYSCTSSSSHFFKSRATIALELFSSLSESAALKAIDRSLKTLCALRFIERREKKSALSVSYTVLDFCTSEEAKKAREKDKNSVKQETKTAHSVDTNSIDERQKQRSARDTDSTQVIEASNINLKEYNNKYIINTETKMTQDCYRRFETLEHSERTNTQSNANNSTRSPAKYSCVDSSEDDSDSESLQSIIQRAMRAHLLVK